VYSVSLKLFGYARFAKCVLPEMRARKWGRIVNIIGRSGHQPRAVYLAGGSINAGLLNLTMALAEECAKDNVLVTGINPGPIDTPRRTRHERPPRGHAAYRQPNLMGEPLQA
jgi:3-oxoacyl-[acyl-carrier protein] reductase